MNKEDLEKIFNEKFCYKIDKWFIDYDWTSSYLVLKNWIDAKDIKQFMFKIIAEEFHKWYNEWYNACEDYYWKK